jgi:hypothetical protein
MQESDLETVRDLVRELRAAIADLEFEDEPASDVAADLDSLESQLGRSSPKPSVIRELLTSVRHTLEGRVGASSPSTPKRSLTLPGRSKKSRVPFRVRHDSEVDLSPACDA